MLSTSSDMHSHLTRTSSLTRSPHRAYRSLRSGPMQAAASPSQAAALDLPRPTRTPGQSKRDKRAAARAAASFTIPRSRADLEPHQLHGAGAINVATGKDGIKFATRLVHPRRLVAVLVLVCIGCLWMAMQQSRIAQLRTDGVAAAARGEGEDFRGIT